MSTGGWWIAKEQVAEIRPQLAKAREIAEKAESENRAMTAEDQKTYDEIMKKGRSVAMRLPSTGTTSPSSRSRRNSPRTSSAA